VFGDPVAHFNGYRCGMKTKGQGGRPRRTAGANGQGGRPRRTARANGRGECPRRTAKAKSQSKRRAACGALATPAVGCYAGAWSPAVADIQRRRRFRVVYPRGLRRCQFRTARGGGWGYGYGRALFVAYVACPRCGPPTGTNAGRIPPGGVFPLIWAVR
jgi:hypothetical protein